MDSISQIFGWFKKEGKYNMSFVELTIVSHDALNGEKVHIRTADIRKIVVTKQYNDKIPMIGEKAQLCSFIQIAGGANQLVLEDPETIIKLIAEKEQIKS